MAWTAHLIPVTQKLHLLVFPLFGNGASECIFRSQTNDVRDLSCVECLDWIILDHFAEV